MQLTYKSALEAAGCVVHNFEFFGSYQGDWIAFVTFENNRGFIHGYFGSCSHCDALELELGDLYFEGTETEQFEALKSFGTSYADFNFYTGEELVKKFSEQAEWDLDAEDMLDFVKSIDVAT